MRAAKENIPSVLGIKTEYEIKFPYVYFDELDQRIKYA